MKYIVIIFCLYYSAITTATSVATWKIVVISHAVQGPKDPLSEVDSWQPFASDLMFPAATRFLCS
jgi:hypothetical protein